MDEMEFFEKYNKYSQEIFNICYGYTKSRFAAEDLMQETFLIILKKNKVFKTAEEERYYFIRIAINQSKNYLLQAYQKRVITSDSLVEVATTPLDNGMKKKILLREIENLPEKLREVIILFYYNSNSCLEIARILHISLSAVKKRLERARKLLKERMSVLYEY